MASRISWRDVSGLRSGVRAWCLGSLVVAREIVLLGGDSCPPATPHVRLAYQEGNHQSGSFDNIVIWAVFSFCLARLALRASPESISTAKGIIFTSYFFSFYFLNYQLSIFHP